MADTLASNEAVAGPSPTKIAHNDTTEPRFQTAPVTLEHPAAPEPEPERDLELVGLPTEFDPDAEPSAPAAKEVVDTEDILEVPIRSIEDEDAEEAAALAELEKRRNRMNGQGDDADGDEEEGDLTEILRGLAGNQGDGDEQGDGEGENDQGEDEIVAEQSEEAEIILGEETAPLEDYRPINEVEAREPPAELEQEDEDVQMQSSMPLAVSSGRSLTKQSTRHLFPIFRISLPKCPYRLRQSPSHHLDPRPRGLFLHHQPSLPLNLPRQVPSEQG